MGIAIGWALGCQGPANRDCRIHKIDLRAGLQYTLRGIRRVEPFDLI
jgi:hypothetical protein